VSKQVTLFGRQSQSDHGVRHVLISGKDNIVLSVFLHVAQQLKSGIRRLTVDVSRSYTVRRTHEMGPL
jgi:hypothetical protein